MSYMSDWLDWKAGKLSDGEIIARCHVDPLRERVPQEVEVAAHGVEVDLDPPRRRDHRIASSATGAATSITGSTISSTGASSDGGVSVRAPRRPNRNQKYR